MKIKTLSSACSADEILKAMRRDGACIVRDLLSEEDLSLLNTDLKPWIDRTQSGTDSFSGRKTKRTGGLVARSPEARPIVTHPLILDAANGFLGAHCERIQLHLTQTIAIGPGESQQVLHRDRIAWGGYIPQSIDPQFNTIWALTDFTEENGATRLIPGSQDWPLDRNPSSGDEGVQATMSRGSVLCYGGSVIHGGGANRALESRVGLNITYCLSWLRQEENQYLSCPPEIARTLSSELTDLLGYTMGNYALGYYANPEMLEGLPDTLPPEVSIGRMPDENKSNTVAPVGENAK